MISGKQGSGKSTLSEMVHQCSARIGYKMPVVLKFADSLYEMHDRVLELLDKYEISHPPKDKRLLQLLGTEWGRSVYGDDIWVRIMKQRIAKLTGPHEPRRLCDPVIIDDCRFENEFDAFPEALRVRLECPESVRKPRTEGWRDVTSHPSEIDLDRYAAHGFFDLYLDTSVTPAAGGMELVLAQLAKGPDRWREKRHEQRS